MKHISTAMSSRKGKKRGESSSSSSSSDAEEDRAKFAFAVWQPPSNSSQNTPSSSNTPSQPSEGGNSWTASNSVRSLFTEQISPPAPHQIQGTRLLHKFIENRIEFAPSQGAEQPTEEDTEYITDTSSTPSSSAIKLFSSSQAQIANADPSGGKRPPPPKIGRSLRGLEDDPSLLLIRRVAGVQESLSASSIAKSELKEKEKEKKKHKKDKDKSKDKKNDKLKSKDKKRHKDKKKSKKASSSSSSSSSSGSSDDENDVIARKMMLSAVFEFPVSKATAPVVATPPATSKSSKKRKRVSSSSSSSSDSS
jgi:hypothetical protein